MYCAYLEASDALNFAISAASAASPTPRVRDGPFTLGVGVKEEGLRFNRVNPWRCSSNSSTIWGRNRLYT